MPPAMIVFMIKPSNLLIGTLLGLSIMGCATTDPSGGAWAGQSENRADLAGVDSIVQAAIDRGEVAEPNLLFYHRQASEEWDVDDPEQLRNAIVEARGEAASWSDLDTIAAQWDEPGADRAYLARVWLNQPVQGASQAFDVSAWRENARPDAGPPEHGALISIGFDGSRSQDSTGLIGTDVVTGWQWLIKGWERPHTAPASWEVPTDEVNAAVDQAFEDWTVVRMYADPRWWETWVDAWAGRHDRQVVIEWQTNAVKRMALSCKAYAIAINAGEVTHSGEDDFTRHIGNARKRMESGYRDDDGEPLWTIGKDRRDSIEKMDYAMAGILSWEARNDAIAAGALQRPEPAPVAAAYSFTDEEMEESA